MGSVRPSAQARLRSWSKASKPFLSPENGCGLFARIAVIEAAPGREVRRVAVFRFANLFDHRMGEFVDDGVDHYAQRLFLILVQVAEAFAAAIEFGESHLADLLSERADNGVEVAFGQGAEKLFDFGLYDFLGACRLALAFGAVGFGDGF